MKVNRKNRKTVKKQSPHLIGFAGKATVDNRLFPLRMNRKYRNLLEQAEYEKNTKVTQRIQYVEQYEYLTGLMKSLELHNINNCNTELLIELEENKTILQRKLHSLEADLECILKNMKGRHHVHKRNSSANATSETKSSTEEKKTSLFSKNIKLINSKFVPEPADFHTESKRNRWSGSYKSQIFVRRNKLQVQAISIDLFSSGEDLLELLVDEFKLGQDANAYNIMLGTKQVDPDETLFAQEIYHGTTVDLNLRLQGGMPKKKSKSVKKSNKKKNVSKPSEINSAESPETWSKQQVTDWVSSMCEEYEIAEEEVSKLKSLNGKGLDKLSLEDWIRRSEDYGDLFHRVWQELKLTFSTSNITEKKGTAHDKVEGNQSAQNKAGNSASSEPTADTSIKENVDEHVFNQSSFSNGLIDKVKSLDDIKDLTPVEDFGTDGKSTIPPFDSVVSVKGVLERRPKMIENSGTLVMRDEPQGAVSSFSALKIAIQSHEENTLLRPYIIKTLFEKLRTGTQVAVKGRVDRLEENDLEETIPQCEIIRFKLVIDSDQHSIVYVERNTPAFKRQLSQPAWLQNYKPGDRIEEAFDRVFCHSTNIDEIMKYVVAFKNSFHGNILVGVKLNRESNTGEVTGLDMGESEIAKWREKLSMTIGSILPSPNEAAAICSTKEEALELYEQKSFILVMKLLGSEKKIVWIHVPKGEARLYVTKSSDVHTFVRTGAETKRLSDFNELFSRLDSLGSRRIVPMSDEELDFTKQCNDIKSQNVGMQKKYQVLKELEHDTKELSYENQEQEFKIIFGDDPVKTIQEKYLANYACGFLNSTGGSIIFGIQEDKKSKIGHIVGTLMSTDEREALLKIAVKTLSNFFPPVNTSQYNIVFHDVSVPNEFIAKYNGDENSATSCVLIRGPADEVGNKWPPFAKDNFPGYLCRVVKVQPQLFCIVLKEVESSGVSYDVGKIVEQFLKDNKKISIERMPENELERILKDLCIIEFTVKRSQYPVHMIRPIDTHLVDREGNLIVFSNDIMMHRFQLGFNTAIQFDIKKFMNHVDHFKHSENSYILVTSPFNFSATENDVYGLVIPKWALAIDFDQYPKRNGHLCQLFNEFNDLHQMERNHCIKTPQNSKLDLNSSRGICWLAARGYHEIEESLSKPDHGSWNMTHRDQLRSLLKTDLASSIKPNYLNIVVLWDEGHEAVVPSLSVILEDILSMNGKRTSVTIVCCTERARKYIAEKLVKPLSESYREIIMEERVCVAPPHVLAMYLSSKLEDPYKPENEFQVPHKREYRGEAQVCPRILPKHLRQNINGYLKMMYIRHGRKHDKSMADERKKFYSGSKITFPGLHENFGIQRTKMEELENNFKILLNDRKSHVSMISLKVERGAGSTTMCLQFLFKHHEEYPCAQLIDIGDRLLTYIKDIYRETKLPLILFVDEEIAHLQDFFDFTKELVEYRHVNVILLFIEPKEADSRKEFSSSRKAASNTRMKSASDHSLYGTCPYKEVILRRELEEEEMDNLTDDLIQIKEDKEGRLRRLRERAKTNDNLRTFVHFGLTAFGQEFSGLRDYIEFRMKKANKEQKTVLSYLSLIHLFTNSMLPANALASFLDKKRVNLDEVFSEPYLNELLSPPGDEMDGRRISFHEVAQEILKQLGSDGDAQKGGGTYNWLFIKSKSVEMAKNVLSINASTKSIDRLTRRLFVTSEYESEKFSSLIRTMTNEKCKRVARDTLLELVNFFPKETSFGAHILAHLAKYYMIEFQNFEKAIPEIETAVKSQKDDSLLRHIHGDIIRIHIQALKNKSEIDMTTIVKHAIQSSDCFAFVRRKRPYVSHGYISDAMVRITVMQAAIKEMGGEAQTSFIDYLIQMIDEMKEKSNYRLFDNKKYLLSLIPDVHQFLNEGVIDPDHKEKWKSEFRKCIGKLENLRRLCDKIQEEKNFFEKDDSTLLHHVALQILILNNSLEIESKPLDPVQIERLVKEVYDPDSSRTMTDQQMKFWLRHSRYQKKAPSLEEIRKQVKNWMDNAKKKGGISPDAEFYNYVINVMIAMKDPKDPQKRELAEKIVKRQQAKKHRRKDDSVLPIEWLCPEDKHHINSMDSLLHHDDLVKETNKQDGHKKLREKQRGRDVIEGFLFEKDIKKWEGTVKEIQRDWQGTIVFKRHFEVRFVPQNVQPSMPSTGDTVRFCLSFDRLGLMAWAVIRSPENNIPRSVLEALSSEEESCSESAEENEGEDEVLDTSLFNQAGRMESAEKSWEDYNGEKMQGVVISTNPEKGFGTLVNPNVPGYLFFHASQLVKPVKNLKGAIEKSTVLSFVVEKLTERTRAADIRVLTEKDRIEPAVERYRDKNKKHSSPSTNRREKDQSVNQTKTVHTKRWEEGVVVRLSSGQDFGFITPENTSYGKDVFFHRRCLVNKGQFPRVNDRVQFYISSTKKGYEANEIRVQNQSPSIQRWDQLDGIQEGYVDSISDDGGNIIIPSYTKLGYLPFYNKDVKGSVQMAEGMKVHFKVHKRGGKFVAVGINVIGN